MKKAFRKINLNSVMDSKHPRIIMNAAGMFACGDSRMVPIDGIPASFFNRVSIRK
jgi:hypothetical protein